MCVAFSVEERWRLIKLPISVTCEYCTNMHNIACTYILVKLLIAIAVYIKHKIGNYYHICIR